MSDGPAVAADAPILVAGGRGMVGAALVRRLRAAGHTRVLAPPRTTLPELVAEMVEADFESARRDALVKSAGFQAYDYHE